MTAANTNTTALKLWASTLEVAIRTMESEIDDKGKSDVIKHAFATSNTFAIHVGTVSGAFDVYALKIANKNAFHFMSCSVSVSGVCVMGDVHATHDVAAEQDNINLHNRFTATGFKYYISRDEYVFARALTDILLFFLREAVPR